MADLLYKQDWEESQSRWVAWWHGEMIDRVCCLVTAPQDGAQRKEVAKPKSIEAQWIDVEYLLASQEEVFRTTFYGGEALPVFKVPHGPFTLQHILGAKPVYREDTIWFDPIIKLWDKKMDLRFNPEHPGVITMKKILSTALQRGEGKFIVSFPSIGMPGDILELLRGGQRLCIDLIENKDAVRQALSEISQAWFEYYELLFNEGFKDKQDGMGNWLQMWAPGRHFSIGCDFSALIGQQMFEEFILPHLKAQTERLEYTIYHLDGEQALKQHLDPILQLPKLNAVQWAPLCNEDIKKTENLPYLKKIQEAGKGLVLAVDQKDIEFVFENFEPKGLCIRTGCDSEADAKEMLRKMRKWTKGPKKEVMTMGNLGNQKKSKDAASPLYTVRAVPEVNGHEEVFKEAFVLRWDVDSGPKESREFHLHDAEGQEQLSGRDLRAEIDHFEVRLAGTGVEEYLTIETKDYQADLKDVWPKLADGYVRYDIVAFDQKAKEIGSSLLWSFIKNAHPENRVKFPMVQGAAEAICWTGEERFHARHIRPFIIETEISDKNVAEAAEFLNVQIAFESGLVSAKGSRYNLDVSSVWEDVPAGFCKLRIEAVNGDGRVLAVSPEYSFFKGKPFDDKKVSPLDYKPYVEKVINYVLGYRTPFAYEPDLPPYLWHSSTNEWAGVSEGSYPLQFEYVVEGYLKYYHWPYARRVEAAFADARQTADWTLEHRTGEKHAVVGLPCTTAVRGEIYGRKEGPRISLLGAAGIAKIYVWMYRETNEQKYLDAAVEVGEALLKFQNADGSWPWRIHIFSGEVTDTYTSMLIPFVTFYELLAQVKPDERYIQAKEKALKWILGNPVKTRRWEGYYCDDPGGKYEAYSEVSHLDAIWTAQYLLDHREEDSSYVSIAADICDWAEDHYIVHGKQLIWAKWTCAAQPNTPAMIEKPSYRRTVTMHNANWIGLLLRLYEATGKKEYAHKAIATANALAKAILPHGAVASDLCDAVLNRRDSGEALWFPSNWYGIKSFVELEEFLQKYPQFREEK
ncbi:MAG: hypothetical protein ABIG61_00430 [Planctomycetota bacterium]